MAIIAEPPPRSEFPSGLFFLSILCRRNGSSHEMIKRIFTVSCIIFIFCVCDCVLAISWVHLEAACYWTHDSKVNAPAVHWLFLCYVGIIEGLWAAEILFFNLNTSLSCYCCFYLFHKEITWILGLDRHFFYHLVLASFFFMTLLFLKSEVEPEKVSQKDFSPFCGIHSAGEFCMHVWTVCQKNLQDITHSVSVASLKYKQPKWVLHWCLLCNKLIFASSAQPVGRVLISATISK